MQRRGTARAIKLRTNNFSVHVNSIEKENIFLISRLAASRDIQDIFVRRRAPERLRV